MENANAAENQVNHEQQLEVRYLHFIHRLYYHISFKHVLWNNVYTLIIKHFPRLKPCGSNEC